MYCNFHTSYNLDKVKTQIIAFVQTFANWDLEASRSSEPEESFATYSNKEMLLQQQNQVQKQVIHRVHIAQSRLELFHFVWSTYTKMALKC